VVRTAEWNTGPNSVLGRAVSLLTAFHDGESELTLSELARRAGLAKSTAHRLLRELEHWDFVHYATEFTGQPPMAEPVDNPAAACRRYPNAALALTNASLWEKVQVCPRCQYPTHRLIQYSNGSALGPAVRTPRYRRRTRKRSPTFVT
jgi:hypothetical protein